MMLGPAVRWAGLRALLRELNAFLDAWLRNLKAQGNRLVSERA
jgi:hypothetical protein